MPTLLYLSIMMVMGDFDIAFGEAVPQEIWALKQDSQREIYDAIIVESITEIRKESILHYRKIRILNENGKQAAELVDRSGQAHNLNGRVVDASGRETTFNRKDFVAFLVTRTRNRQQRSKILIPPGLTTDCVVEMSWIEPASDGLPLGNFNWFFFVQDSYFCLKKVFRFPKNGIRGSGNLATRFISASAGVDRYLKEEKSRNTTTLTSTDVAPVSRHPYGNLHLDRNTAYVQAFKTIPDLGSETDRFFKQFSKDILGGALFGDHFKRPAEYKTWIAELKQKLPDNPIDAMTMVYHEFRDRISSRDLLPPHKKTAIIQDFQDGEDTGKMLTKIFQRGYGPTRELGLLFYHVARDCKLPFQLLFTSSIYGQHFLPESLNPFAINLNFPLFGIEVGENRWMIYTPQWQEYSPGHFPSRFQGVPSLAVNPGNRWSYKFTNTPRFDENAHRRVRRYQTAIDNRGKARFSFLEESNGQFNATLRNRYYVLPQDERNAHLRESWQNRLSDWHIESAAVENAESLRKTVHLTVTGTTNYDLGHLDWIAIDPFPGSGAPLENPAVWPKNRSQPIILPHRLTQIDLAVITLPQGWQLEGSPSWGRANGVGEVSMQAIQEGNQLTVRRDIIVKHDVLMADLEKALKFFMAWIVESNNQTIALRTTNKP